jgi:hypothetical protein
MATPMYTPRETTNAREQAFGRKLTLIGAVLTGIGGIGILATAIINAISFNLLGILTGPISGLAWLSLVAGVAVFVWGFTKIRDARAARH